MDPRRGGIVNARLVCGGSTEPCKVAWRLELWAEDTYFVELTSGRGQFDGSGSDLFEALVVVRRQLESIGCLLAVQGSRLDAYPSGMGRDMGGGRRIYVMTMGRPADAADLVDTLAEADPSQLATVEEQERYFDEWFNG